MRRLGVVLAALLFASAQGALAQSQVESREGIALQNQILQLRQELDMLRRGGTLPAPAPSTGGSFLGGGAPRPSAAAPQAEIVQALLERVQRLEEDLRDVRGRAEQSEFRERQLREQLDKLQGDMDFRLQQLEQQRQGAAPSAAPRPAPQAAANPAPAAAAPRTPQRALAEGQAALSRRDYASAEAAAREVIAARDSARLTDAQILLGDALLGRRDYAGAAIAYDDARRRSPQGSRAPEATVGIANAFIGLNNNRDACALLADLRSSHPNLSGAVAERAAEARRRAQCR